jgi:hypothetical protein
MTTHKQNARKKLCKGSPWLRFLSHPIYSRELVIATTQRLRYLLKVKAAVRWHARSPKASKTWLAVRGAFFQRTPSTSHSDYGYFDSAFHYQIAATSNPVGGNPTSCARAQKPPSNLREDSRDHRRIC